MASIVREVYSGAISCLYMRLKSVANYQSYNRYSLSWQNHAYIICRGSGNFLPISTSSDRRRERSARCMQPAGRRAPKPTQTDATDSTAARRRKFAAFRSRLAVLAVDWQRSLRERKANRSTIACHRRQSCSILFARSLHHTHRPYRPSARSRLQCGATRCDATR